MEHLCYLIVLSPLLGAVLLGLFSGKNNELFASLLGVSMVGISAVASLLLLARFFESSDFPIEIILYEWATLQSFTINFGFYLDNLSLVMASVVTTVSFLVHIFTIGYMRGDPGYTRFYCYINLFTFAMLLLVFSPNLVQLFLGWEGVGVVSYLLIGFWFEKSTAANASFKAFIVNRVGDFGFILAIAVAFYVFNSLDFSTFFSNHAVIERHEITLFGNTFSAVNLFALLLFIGAMGKSAQIPLHVWLPDSMEGPTPISALIHAATMVTAGIFLVARLYPFFDLAPQILSFILVVGTITSVAMGLVGIVQNDIKRIIAYSTLSQLGLMVAALGVGAYQLAIFHLITHAFFKALLFLGAGSVIHACHHNQDIRYMGGLKKHLPVTFMCMLVGTLALTGFPGLSGFYSKDAILHSIHLTNHLLAQICYWLLILGVFISALYSWRLLFVVFYGSPANGSLASDSHNDPHESPISIIGPLVALAIPSAVLGHIMFSYFSQTAFLEASDIPILISVSSSNPWLLWKELVLNPAFYAMILGIFVTWYCYIYRPGTAQQLSEKFPALHRLFLNKFWIDELYQKIISKPIIIFSHTIWKYIDNKLIDHTMVHGFAHIFGVLSQFFRKIQTGLLHQYIFIFISATTLLGIYFMTFL